MRAIVDSEGDEKMKNDYTSSVTYISIVTEASSQIWTLRATI